MFGWLSDGRKPADVVIKETLGLNEELLKICLDEGRVQREEKERQQARDAKQGLVNRQATADARMRVDAIKDPKAIADMIAERSGRQGASDEQIEMEDTVKDLLCPPTPAEEESTPEPADLVKWLNPVEIEVGKSLRTRIGYFFFSLGCRLIGYPIDKNKGVVVQMCPPKKKYVPGEQGHRHVHVDKGQSESRSFDPERLCTGKEAVRLKEQRAKVLKNQSEYAAFRSDANDPVRRQLAAKEQEENPEEYVKTAGKLPKAALHNPMAPTMDEEVTDRADPFVEGAEEDLRAFRATGRGKTPGAQSWRDDV